MSAVGFIIWRAPTELEELRKEIAPATLRVMSFNNPYAAANTTAKPNN
jgi:hypothetical protein